MSGQSDLVVVYIGGFTTANYLKELLEPLGIHAVVRDEAAEVMVGGCKVLVSKSDEVRASVVIQDFLKESSGSHELVSEADRKQSHRFFNLFFLLCLLLLIPIVLELVRNRK